MTAIYFYTTRGRFGCFSNFSRHPITMGGKVWPTTEHYYQAMKFEDVSLQEEIRTAATPKVAARIGRDVALPLRPDWHDRRLDVMREALYAKFTQHPELREVLLGTEDREIVEHSLKDRFWGNGGDGSGQNMLGKFLMELRHHLRRES